MVADWGHEKLSATRMSQGVFAIGLGSVLAGVVGGFSTLAYPDNVGMLRSTPAQTQGSPAQASIGSKVRTCSRPHP